VSENYGKIYSPEFQQAYEFAKKNWITTMIASSKRRSNITRKYPDNKFLINFFIVALPY
jgi:hypothetical protein